MLCVCVCARACEHICERGCVCVCVHVSECAEAEERLVPVGDPLADSSGLTHWPWLGPAAQAPPRGCAQCLSSRVSRLRRPLSPESGVGALLHRQPRTPLLVIPSVRGLGATGFSPAALSVLFIPSHSCLAPWVSWSFTLKT